MNNMSYRNRHHPVLFYNICSKDIKVGLSYPNGEDFNWTLIKGTAGVFRCHLTSEELLLFHLGTIMPSCL